MTVLMVPYLHRNADEMPQIFGASGITWLIKDIFRCRLHHYYRMQEIILSRARHEQGGNVLSLDALRNWYPSQHLLPLLQDLVCPVTEMMRTIVLRLPLFYFDGFPHPEEYKIYGMHVLIGATTDSIFPFASLSWHLRPICQASAG